MSRPSWHRQAGLEAAVNAVRPDLDHEVRVDMMLGIALAVPGHHIPPIMSLGGLAARRTSSSAHRVSTSYKGAQLGACLSSVDRGTTRRTGSGQWLTFPGKQVGITTFRFFWKVVW